MRIDLLCVAANLRLILGEIAGEIEVKWPKCERSEAHARVP